MRQLKFRAWDGGKMVLPPPEYSSKLGPYLLTLNGRCYIYGVYQDLIWMQFTGLLDKNGKEIFEGDRVQCCVDGECSDHQVAWGGELDSGYPAFDLIPYVEVESNGISYFNAAGTIEVIGNIYETPLEES